MTELVPGGIPVKKSVPQYQTMLARVRPRDLVGRAVRRLAADQLADLVRLDVRLKPLKAELTEAVLASGSHLMDLPGIGSAGAARILADVGDVRRFGDRNHFASRPAPPRSTPPPASRSATGSPAPATAG